MHNSPRIQSVSARIIALNTIPVSVLGTVRRQNQPPILFLYKLFTANTTATHARLYANSC